MPAQSMFFKAATMGGQWDTWLYWHEGTYYLFLLAGEDKWHSIVMATSPDGVHWNETGTVLSKAPGVTWMGTGSTWKSPNYEKDKKFFLNFSEFRGPRQTIFFAESMDLLHWRRLPAEYEFKQDERWYNRDGRWDCIYTIPRPGGGLYGYWTATPKPETGGRFGFGQSADGVKWEALPPPKVTGVGNGEVGAVERIGDKYYMMFGTHPIMVTLVADQPEGPFHAAKKNFCLLSGHTYFSRFLPTPQGILVNHHSIARNGQVYFTPLKRAVVDSEGTLRLGWWEGNEKLKHEIIEVKLPETAQAERPVAMLGSVFDPQQGVILEGDLQLPATADAPARGLYIECAGGQGSALLLHHDGVAEFGPMQPDGSRFKCESQINRERSYGQPAKFRLLLKNSLIEFYLDDVLIQCYSLPNQATGKIGLIQGGQSGTISKIKAWR